MDENVTMIERNGGAKLETAAAMLRHMNGWLLCSMERNIVKEEVAVEWCTTEGDANGMMTRWWHAV